MAGSRIALTFAAALLSAPLAASSASADGPFDGRWQAGPLRVSVDVQSWGPDCGRRPPATWTEPGGNVQIRHDGSQLAVSGAIEGRTDACWTDNRSVRRVAMTAQETSWRAQCSTPSGHAQPETGTYTLRADGSDRLLYQGTTRWDWRLNESRCLATRSETRVFTRATAGAQTPTPTPIEAEPEERACTPGAPVRISLRPGQARIEPGERVCFRARVVDANGCAVAGRAITWTLERPASLRGDLSGSCFQASGSAAEAEGTFRVIAQSGSMRARASVEVRTADLSDLIARRAFDTSAEDRAEGEAEIATEGGSRVAARALRTGDDDEVIWPAAIALSAMALVTVVLGVLLVRRGRRRRRAGADAGAEANARSAADAARTDPPPAAGVAVASAQLGTPGVLACPVCGSEISGDTLFCPNDGARLLDPADVVRGGQGMICPACRRGYPADARYCPHDSEELVPYALFAARQAGRGPTGPERAKICPKCGDRYRKDVTFCGKDGAELVLVN